VIPGLRSVVEDRAVGGANEVFERFVRLEFALGEAIQRIDVVFVMPAVVILHGLRGNMRRKGIFCIGQLG
jgi:hypothetical protein